MAKVKKIVDGVVVEVDDNTMVKVIENGVVVEKPANEVNFQKQPSEPSPEKKSPIGTPFQGGLQGSQDTPPSASSDRKVPDRPLAGQLASLPPIGSLIDIDPSRPTPVSDPRKLSQEIEKAALSQAGLKPDDFRKKANDAVRQKELGEVEMEMYVVDGKAIPAERFKDLIFDQKFIDETQKGLHNVQINPRNNEYVGQFLDKDLVDAASRNLQSGTRTGDKWESFMSGAARAASGVASMETMYYDVVEEVLGIPLRRDLFGVAELQETSEELAKKSEEYQKKTFQYRENFLNSVLEGKWSDAFQQAGDATSASVPYSAGAAALTYAGGPALAFSVLAPMSSSAEYASMKVSEDQAFMQLSRAEKLLRSNVVGLLEAATDIVAGRAISRSFDLTKSLYKGLVKEVAEKQGLEAADKAAKELSKSVIRKYGENIGLQMTEEFFAEGGSTAGTMLYDDLMGIRSHDAKDYITEILNSSLLGAASGGITTGVLSGPAAIYATGLTATNKLKSVFDKKLYEDPSAVESLSKRIDSMKVPNEVKDDLKENLAKREKAVKSVPKEKVSDTETVDTVQEIQSLEESKKGLLPVYQEPIQEEINAKVEKLKSDVKKEYPAPTVNTTPTESNYASVNRNDGKGTIDLTQEEYLAEMERRGTPVEEVAAEVAPTETVEVAPAEERVPSMPNQIPMTKLTKEGEYDTEDPFTYQQLKGERLIQKSETENGVAKWDDNSLLVRERIENAGDILRELALRGPSADRNYLYEKINKLKGYFDKLKGRDLLADDRPFGAMNRNEELFRKLRRAWYKQPTSDDAQAAVRRLVLELVDGNSDGASLNRVLDNVVSEIEKIVPVRQENVSEEVQQLTPPTDAVQEQSTESVPVRQQPEARQGVREEDTQGQEAPQEGEAVKGEVVSEQTQAPKRKLNLGARLSNIAQKVQEEGVEGSLLKKTAMWNRMGKRMRRSPFGANLMSEMQQERKKYGYELRPGKTGRMTVVNPQGKEVRWKSDFMTKEEKARRAAERKDAKKYKASILKAEPISVEHYIAQALASGTRFNRAQLENLLGKDYDIPSWMRSEKGMSIQPDYIASLMRDAGYGMDQESEVDPKDIEEAIVFFAERNGRKKAFEYAEEIYNSPEDARQSMTEEEAREMQEYMEQNKEFFPDSTMAYDGISAIDQLTEEQAQALEDEILAQDNYESSTKFIQDAERYAAETEAGVGQTETKNDVPRDDSQGEAERKAIAKAIRDKKITGTLFVDPLFGGVALTKAVYNGALELAAKLVEQNTEAGKVIAAVMKYVDDAMKGTKFNRNAVEEGFKKRLWFVADNDLFNDLKEVAREYGQSLNGKTPSATGLFNYIKEQDDTFTASNRHVSDDVFKAVFGTTKPEKPAAPVTKPSEKATKEAVKEARAEERKKASEAAKEKAAKVKEKADADKKKATDKATEAAKQKYVNIGYRIGEAFGKLAGEIRGKAEGRKEGVKEGGRLQKQFAEQVNEILQEAIAEAKRKSPGFTVTATQLAASAKKLLSVNFNSPLSIERAVEYVDKVLNNATYSNDLSTANKLKKANIKRLERNDYGIDDGSMRQALKLNAESLSVEELADYLNFLSDISRGPYNRKKHEATVQKYAEMYREQKLLAQQGRTEDEKEASEKRKEAMSQSANEAKQEAIDEFEFERTDMNTPVSEAYQKDYSFIKTITKAELESLSEGKLRELSNSIRNMREGIAYASGNTSEVIRELKARRMAESAKEITEGRAFKQLLRDVFMPFKVSFSGLMDRTSTDRKKKLASMMPMNRIDSMMKGFTDSKIYDTFIQPISTAYSSFTEKMNQIDKGYDRLYSKVGKSIIPWKREQQRQDEMVKLSLIAIQKEFESNVGNDEVSSVADYMEAIAEAARFNSDYAPFANRYLSIYESMLEPDRTFDYRKQEGALDDDTKTFYEYAEAINQANTDYVEVSAIRNKENVSLRQAYTPISVALIQYSNLSEIQNMANTFSSDENVKPTTQSGNIKKRTRGSKPLYLDFHANAKRATRSVLMDYYMREPLRSVSKAFNLTAKDSDMSPEARAFFSAIEANIAKAVRNTFVNEYYEPTGVKAIVELWKKRGYQMALASIPRAGVEFASNFTHAAMYKPKELAMGAMMLQEYKGNDEDLRSLAIFAESAQVSRMFEKSTSLMAEQGSGTRGSSTVYGRAIDRFSDSIMSAPDRAIARPLWLGSFSRTFEAASGEKLDISKMVNDPQYRLDNEAAIQRARNVADANLSQGFASLNPFEGVVASQVTKDDNIVETFDKYMTRFMRYEFQSAVDSLNGLVGKNELSKAEAARLLGATILRMSAYQFAMSYAVDGFYSLIEAVTGTGPEDEEEDDDELSQKIGSSVAGTIISLLVFRRLGNLAKVPIGYAIETLNSRFGEELGMRNGEYDPYKDSMVFSQIPGDADKGDMNLEKLAPKFMGPYGAVAQTGIRFKNLLFNAGDPFGGKIIKPSLKDPDAIDKAHREIAVRIAPELFMETIGLPVPRDIRNLIIRDVFKDFQENKPSADSSIEKAKEEVEAKSNSFIKATLLDIGKKQGDNFISQGKVGVTKRELQENGTTALKVAEKHNVSVFKEKYKSEKYLLQAFITANGTGEAFVDPKDLAKDYLNISKESISNEHKKIIKAALSHKGGESIQEYMKDFERAFDEYKKRIEEK